MSGPLSDERLAEVRTAISRAAVDRDDLNPIRTVDAWILAAWDLLDEVTRLRGENGALRAANLAMNAELDDLHAIAADKLRLLDRIGNARTELRKQHLRADHTLHPDVSGPVMAALEAVETHLTDPEHRPAERGTER